MLLVTMLITGLGSLYNAFAPGYAHFVAARVITGIGIGADLAIVNSYINEVAPRRSRARFTTLIFVMSAVGALVGIWLGLWLTTPATPWPEGLPFAQAGQRDFANGWRWMYGHRRDPRADRDYLMRIELPESPRWLDRATAGRPRPTAIVKGMEPGRPAAARSPSRTAEVPAEAVQPSAQVPYSDAVRQPAVPAPDGAAVTCCGSSATSPSTPTRPGSPACCPR